MPLRVASHVQGGMGSLVAPRLDEAGLRLALRALNSIGWYEEERGLEILAPLVPPEMLADVLDDLTRDPAEFSGDRRRLGAIVPHLPETVVAEAVATALGDPSRYAALLVALAPRYPTSQRANALAAMREVQDPNVRALATEALSAAVDGPPLDLVALHGHFDTALRGAAAGGETRLAAVLVTLGPVVRPLAGADDGRNGEG